MKPSDVCFIPVKPVTVHDQKRQGRGPRNHNHAGQGLDRGQQSQVSGGSQITIPGCRVGDGRKVIEFANGIVLK